MTDEEMIPEFPIWIASVDQLAWKRRFGVAYLVSIVTIGSVASIHGWIEANVGGSFGVESGNRRN